MRIFDGRAVDVVHLVLTAGAIVVLALCALAERLGAGRRPIGPFIGNFAAASTVVAVLGFGLMARDCLLSGSCAPSTHRENLETRDLRQVVPHAASRLDPADPAR